MKNNHVPVFINKCDSILNITFEYVNTLKLLRNIFNHFSKLHTLRYEFYF
jgi:hypothetical protein